MEKVLTAWNTNVLSTLRDPPQVKKPLFQRRLQCLNALTKIEEDRSSSESEYTTVTSQGFEQHTNAYRRMERYSAEYKKVYEECKELLKG